MTQKIKQAPHAAKQDRYAQANSIARQSGFGKATAIVIAKRFGPGRGKVIDYTPYGYRKKSNDEYVPRAYLRNFGWKNTYYQCAECVVALNPVE